MSVTVAQKPTLDKYGNIRVHALEGLDMPFQRKNEAGNFIDISGHTYVFYLEGVGSFPTVDGADAFEKRIQVTPAELATMAVGSATTYALRDETGAVPIVLLEGNFKVEGFRVS